ncbi:MAG: hypothetical protein QW590_00950 [Candidatus Bilamarchaeaceae archaeon]
MFEDIDDKAKQRILDVWKTMSEIDKAHFINQVAIAMSIWGSDEMGKRLVVEVIRLMCHNGTKTLADFGLYVEKLKELKAAAAKKNKIERAALILEGYRIKHNLPSIPHRDITI